MFVKKIRQTYGNIFRVVGGIIFLTKKNYCLVFSAGDVHFWPLFSSAMIGNMGGWIFWDERTLVYGGLSSGKPG